MASWPERRVQEQDYHYIRSCLTKALERAKSRSNKLWLHTVDMDRVMDMLRSRDTCHIVDGYLVVYDIVTPSYSNLRALAEVMICRLQRGGDFSSVTRFLSRKAEEAGCVIMMAGTALSFSDESLASMYKREGFSVEGFSMTKGI